MIESLGVLAPVAALLLIVAVLRARGCAWRRAFIAAATIWGVLLVFITEGLSVVSGLTYSAVLTAWLLVAGVAIALLVVSRETHAVELGSCPVPLEWPDQILLTGIGILVFLVGLTAVIAPPNTGDVLFYHMPRVVMWISNRSVAFYPTLNYAQLVYGPWAEYTMLHLDLLFGSDRLVNLVEWGAYAGMIVTASLIAERLGANGRGQLLAAVACVTLPVAVLEASGAKDNCAVALWIGVAVYFLLEYGERPTWPNLVGFGVGAALAILTKGTAYVFLPPLVAGGWLIAKQPAKIRFLWSAPALIAILLLINGPLYARNYRLTGSPSGVGFRDLDDLAFANNNHSPAGIAANVVRNVAIGLTIRNGIDYRIGRLSAAAIRFIGQNPDDPRAIMMPDFLHFETPPLTAREDLAGAPLQLLLFGAAMIAMVGRRRRVDYRLLIFSAGVIGAFVAFCALLRWQLWGVRYQMPVLMLEAVVIGVVIELYTPKLTFALGLIMIATAMPFALLNQLRPLLSARHAWPVAPAQPRSILRRDRTELYFADQREALMASYLAAAQAVRAQGCQNVGIDSALEDYDYLFFAALDRPDYRPQTWYTGVYNLTRGMLQAPRPKPCAVVCFACARVKRKWQEYQGVGGRVSIFGDIAVFSAKGRNANSGEAAVRVAADPPARAVAARVMQEFHQLNLMDSDPQAATLRAAVDQWPSHAHELELRTQALGQLNSDAVIVLLYTTRERREASLDEPLTPGEMTALLTARDALASSIEEKSEELKGLKTYEDSLRAASARPVKGAARAQ